MPNRCTHLRELMAVQRTIIERHIAEHLWFQHITDLEEGMEDFLAKFAWAMREVYCGYMCQDRADCEIAYNYLPELPDPSNPMPSDILEQAKETIIRRHLDKHKWFQHIEDPEEAKKDFIAKFLWIIQELICGHCCDQRFECPVAKDFFARNKNIAPEK